MEFSETFIFLDFVKILLIFIRSFLKACTFRIWISSHSSSPFQQLQGVPQESILSVALFAVNLTVFLIA